MADEAAKSFGDDPFPYGIEANRKTLDAFCRFAHAQGITAARLTPEDLFPKSARGPAEGVSGPNSRASGETLIARLLSHLVAGHLQEICCC